MTQLKWGIGGVLTLAVVAVGGNLYADKSLKAYYQHSTKQSNDLKLQYQQFQKPFYGMNRGTFGFLMNKFKIKNLKRNILKAKSAVISPLEIKLDR